MEADKAKFLITGGSGFTGQYLKQEIERAQGSVFCLASDLRDFNSLVAEASSISPDYIVHLAAVSDPQEGDRDKLFSVNVTGTTNLLTAFTSVLSPPKKIILASSSHVYGRQAGSLDEELECVPTNHYGASKLAMERLVTRFDTFCPIVITRPFNYTGVGQSERFFLPKVVGAFRRGDAVLQVGDLTLRRDFSDVRWVARAYLALCLSEEVRGGIFNLASGEAVGLNTVIEICENLSKKKIKVKQHSAYFRPGETPQIIGSNQKLSLVFDEVPTPVCKTLEWMLSGEGDTIR